MEKKIILGVDIGHGESTASYVFLRTGNKKIRPLYVKEKLTKVMTTVTYCQNGEKRFGEDNLPNPLQDVLVAYFKRSPEQWDEKVKGIDKSCKEVMKDFIELFVESVLSPDHNQELEGINKEEVILYVGCPSDSVWMEEGNRTEYEELIREATGIVDCHVKTESTAAVFSTFSGQAGQQVPLRDGTAVFDFGSSTTDFTYLLIQECICEASISLGASAIETNLLKNAVKEAVENGDLKDKDDIYGYDEDEVHGYGKDKVRLTLGVRKDKEAWFGDRTNRGECETNPEGISKTISYIPSDRDENGKLNGKPKLKISPKGNWRFERFDYDIDKEVMYEIISKKGIYKVVRNGYVVNSISYESLCESFLRGNKYLLQNHKLPLKTVILTGGASRMPIIKKICKRVFSEERLEIVLDESPSYCVSEGLCQIGLNYQLLDTVKQEQKSAFDQVVRTALSEYEEKVKSKLTDFFYDDMLNFIENSGQIKDGITIQELQDKLTLHFGEVLTVDKINKMLESENIALEGNVRNSLVQSSRSAARRLYQNDQLAGQFELGTDWKLPIDMSNGFTPDGTVIDGVVFASVLRKIVAGVMAGIIGSVLAIVLSFIPAFNLVVAGLSALFTYAWITEHPNIKIKEIDKAVTEIQKKESTVKKDISKELSGMVSHLMEAKFGNNNDAFKKAMDDELDKVIDIVALEYFNRRIHG